MQFNGLAFFIGIHCTNQVFFDDARFTCTADGLAARFDDVNFGGFVTFPGASFRLGNESAVRFRDVVFEDIVDFTNTHFQCHVEFDNASFASVADFIDTSFESLGSTARFRGAAVVFKKIAVAAKGVLTFMSTDPNDKMFSHDVVFSFREEPEGLVRFENVNFNRLTIDSRERLTQLAKTGRVEIGSGCIKYRFQTGIRTIWIDGSNQPLIVEICQTFANYFTASNGLNLGFEIVERDKSKVSFFYFTDEDISGEEFLERLEHTEERMWNLLSANPDERSPGPEGVLDVTTSSKRKTSVINAVDVISALIGIFFRVGARVALGAWTVRDTRALLSGIRFNDTGADGRAESLHQVLENKYTGKTLFDLNGEQNQLLPPIVRKGESTMDSPPVRILFLGANSSRSPLELDREVRKIQNNLKLARERDNLVFKQEWAVTVDSLMQAMLDESPTIVHFSGHGNESGIILEDESGEPRVVPADALSSLFRLFRDTVQCVVLNSCYSEAQARVIRQHIPYVIGMRTGILDSTAIAFSTGFYKALGAGRDVPFAFDMGGVSIKMESASGEDVPILI